MHCTLQSGPSHRASMFDGHAIRLFVTYCPPPCDLGRDVHNSEFHAERREAVNVTSRAQTPLGIQTSKIGIRRR
jgi:hypothetical protein